MDKDWISVGAPLPRMVRAQGLDGRRVLIVWKSGKQQEIDLTPALASHRSFVRLRTDDGLFGTVKVNDFGDALEWADGSELAAVWIEELAEGLLDNAGFRDAMARLNMSLDGMAAHLGIARRLVADYRKDKPVPRHVALATRHLLALRGADHEVVHK